MSSTPHRGQGSNNGVQVEATHRASSSEEGPFSPGPRSRSGLDLLPDTILVGLQHDAIHFLNELKYLLLFFEKPRLMLARYDGLFLDEEAFAELQAGRKARTSMWDGEGEGIDNAEWFRHEEWPDVLAACDPVFQRVNLDVTSETSHDDNIRISGGEIGDVALEAISSMRSPDTATDEDGDFRIHIAELMTSLGLQIIHKAVETCREHHIPMMWPDEQTSFVANLYYSKILERANLMEACQRARIAVGGVLLQQMLRLKPLNMLDISIDDILRFRTNNRDLLENFLVTYRAFLTEVQGNPRNASAIVTDWEQRFAEALNELDNNIRRHKSERNRRWLRFVGGDAYEITRQDAKISSWRLLTNSVPLLLKAALNRSEDVTSSDREQLYTNKFSYLWLAHHRFTDHG